MTYILQLIADIVTQMMYIASDPIFLIVSLLIIRMYKKTFENSTPLITSDQISVIAIKDILRGLIIGSCMSLVLKEVGIVIPLNYGLLIFLPITLVLGVINTRWVCFSYVIPVTYFICSILETLNIYSIPLPYSKLVLLIGILHLLEAMLILLYGEENTYSVPLYRDNHIVQGNILQKFWMIPLAIFYSPNTIDIGIPIYTIIGYREVAIKRTVKYYTVRSCVMLVVYAALVIALGIAGEKGLLPLGLAMLVIPLMHESMIRLGEW